MWRQKRPADYFSRPLISIVTNQQIQKISLDRHVHRVHITEISISSILSYFQCSFCKRKTLPTMPPVRTSRNRKPPPEGFDDIEDTLLEFSNKMKDAENAPHDGKKKHETLWPIFQISHQRELTPYSPCRPRNCFFLLLNKYSKRLEICL